LTCTSGRDKLLGYPVRSARMGKNDLRIPILADYSLTPDAR
jgi:hypothetical protein